VVAIGTLSLLASMVFPTATATALPASGPTAHTATVSAYWLVASDGGIFSFGGAPYYGSTGNIHLNQPIVGMATAANSSGYWLVASDGGIFSFGSAPFYGSAGSMHLNRPVVGMAAAPNSSGYWLVASDGGIFSFGNAPFYGSMGNQHLNQPIVGMAATPDGGGYWLVAADGGIFSFGDAHFYGSTGSIPLNRPIVGMTATPDGGGYWFTASDGGVFAFGDAPFDGSLGSVPQSRPIVAVTATASGGGYWMSNSNGAVSQFGNAYYWGSAPQVINRPVVGMAEATGTGAFSGGSYQSGSYGYDISKWQYPTYPPPPHAIGIVQAAAAAGPTLYDNPYLGYEAAWAGAGLNLYIYLAYATAPSSGDPACSTSASPGACNYGFNTALSSFDYAVSSGVDTSVAWWLDVESDASWTGNLAANAAVVQGAIDGLHSVGLNSVGIYSQASHWSSIVGSYSPGVPEWVANWGTNSPPFNPAQYCSGWNFASGPVAVVQYTDGATSNGFDNDYAC
jgi:hypothetical protein